jgi:hypothetical protein
VTAGYRSGRVSLGRAAPRPLVAEPAVVGADSWVACRSGNPRLGQLSRN